VLEPSRAQGLVDVVIISLLLPFLDDLLLLFLFFILFVSAQKEPLAPRSWASSLAPLSLNSELEPIRPGILGAQKLVNVRVAGLHHQVCHLEC